MAEPFLAEIRIFAGNFAPKGWALCNGQIMSIAQNAALFSLLGVNFGGNGTSTFGLPNLQGSVPMHWGSGAGLSQRTIGESGGTDTVTLLLNQIPAHVHTFNCGSGSKGDGNTAAGQILADEKTGGIQTYATATDGTLMGQLAPTQTSQPHQNMQPYQVLNFIIALQGIFPSRS